MLFDGTNPASTAYSVDEERNLYATNNPWRDEKNRWCTLSLFYELAGQKYNKIYNL